MRFLLSTLFVLSFAGCQGTGLGVPGGHPDGGHDGGADGGTGCAAHTDQSSCDADPACEDLSCRTACGQGGFIGCYEKGTRPELDCPFIACCEQHTDQASCEADPACISDGCKTTCEPDGFAFFGCYQNGTSPPEHSCPAIECDHACTQHVGQVTCEGDPACFAIFEDPGTCDCSGEGCCMTFARCADAPAFCSFDGTPDCGFAPIECDQAAGFVAVVENGCVSGCTRLANCALGE